MLKALHDYIHNYTAKICEDLVQPPDDLELKEPNPIRRCARLIAIVVAGAMLLAAIVVMAMHIPKLQSEKRIVSTNSTDEVAELLHDAGKNGLTVNCPCQNQIMSWCSVTTFHIMRAPRGASTFMNVFNFTKEQGGEYIPAICKNTQKPLKETICERILSPILDNEDSRTFLPTASAYNSPKLLYLEIATRIDTNAYEQSNAFYYLDSTPNRTEEFMYSQGLRNVIRQMQSQFLKKSSSSLQDYWIASKDIRKQYNLTFSYGMDVSWEMYLQTCKPVFCDVEYEISSMNRALRAMGQVGGLTTVFTLILRFIVWPSVKFAFRFPKQDHLPMPI